MTETSAEIARSGGDAQPDREGAARSTPAVDRQRTNASKYGVAAAIFCGFFVAAVVVRFRDFYPQGDLALAEFKLRDLISDPPLVGAYSRFQWSHPGPAMYYALWPLYKLFGSTGSAVMSATLIWHGLWVALGAALLARRGNAAAVGFSVLAAILMLGTGADLLLYPWNPYLNISVFLTFVIAIWLTVEGGRVALVVATLAGSVLVQNHVGLVLPVAAGAAVVAMFLVLGLIRRRRHDSVGWADVFEPIARPVGLSVLVGLAMWSLPVVQQLRNQPGNIGLLIEFFRNRGPGSEPRVGMSAATRILGQYLSVSTPWAGGELTISRLSGGIEPISLAGPSRWPVIGALGLAALVSAIIGRRWPLVRLLAIEMLMIVVAWIAIGSIAGAPFPYLLVWVDGSSILLAATAITAIVLSLVPTSRLSQMATPGPSRLRLGIATALIAGSILSISISRSPSPYADRAALIEQLSAQLEGTYTGTDPIWFAPPTNEEARTFITGLMIELERAGHPTTANTYERLALGVARTRDTAGGAIELFVAEGTSIEEAAADPKNRQVAIVDEFSPAERKKLAEMEAAVEKSIAKPAKNDLERSYQAASIDELLKFRDNRLRVAVFERTR